jgi:tetratricopeptide (TPR) repeat protein
MGRKSFVCGEQRRKRHMKKRNALSVWLLVIGGLFTYGCYTEGYNKYADDFFNQGVVWFQKGEYDQAIEEFTKVLEMAPEGSENYVVYYNRGLAYYKMRDYGRAIKDFNTALLLVPGGGLAGKYKPEIYDSTMEVKAETPKIKYELFNTYKARGDAWFCEKGYSQAIDDYNMALKFGAQRKELPMVFNGRAWAKFETGNFDGAIEDFSSALGIDPKLARSYYGRAHAWSKKGDMNMALRDASMAHKLKPDNREYEDLVFKLKATMKD